MAARPCARRFASFQRESASSSSVGSRSTPRFEVGLSGAVSDLRRGRDDTPLLGRASSSSLLSAESTSDDDRRNFDACVLGPVHTARQRNQRLGDQGGDGHRDADHKQCTSRAVLWRPMFSHLRSSNGGRISHSNDRAPNVQGLRNIHLFQEPPEKNNTQFATASLEPCLVDASTGSTSQPRESSSQTG